MNAQDFQPVPVQWSPAFRIVPTRFPSVSLFDRVAAPEDFDALYALEAMTNDRLRDELGDIALVPADERVFGPGTTPIMAAFTHLNPSGSRFSDGTHGVFYAAEGRETAMAETRYHHARFLRATRQEPIRLPMRLYRVTIEATLHDLRQADDDALYSPSDYTRARELARQLRATNSEGVVYRSVRRAGGECVGLFKPRGASDCSHAAHLEYAWDGAQFAAVFEKIA